MKRATSKSAAAENCIRFGVVGLGMMGRTHIEAIRAASQAGFACRLVAVCDGDPSRLDGRARAGGNVVKGGFGLLFDPRSVRTGTQPETLLADSEVDVVSICTPTDTHVPLALAALRAGKHVLCEKPLGLTARQIEPLLRFPQKPLLMPALCMRFWPGWRWLRDQIRARTFGRVQSAVFCRLASRPTWSPGFYQDPRRSGGALVDLHIHDADFVRFCFGMPSAVSSTGSLDHVTTLYHFERGPAHVVAEGGWDHDGAWPFQMAFTVVFERATADFDFRREPKLLLYAGGNKRAIELEPLTGYDGEIRHLVQCLSGGVRKLDATALDGFEVARLLEAEKKSLESGKRVSLAASARARPAQLTRGAASARGRARRAAGK